ncbi:MAG: glycoside hydrolase family 18 protein [Bacteroidales bacterium]|nr:glycoside hydrolase family 18 protein [Bacteroidales bacterium]
MKKLLCLCALLSLFSCTRCTEENNAQKEKEDPKKVIVAYVTYWDSVIPDPSLVTHINYAFGKVSNSFNSVEISNPARLRQMVALKERNSDLKILLSIGGWGAGNFSEMAADATLRKQFCADCLAKCKSYSLDGIDLDWEYPTIDWADISSSPNDTDNYTLLLQDLREALGETYLITMASSADAKYVDFKNCIQYMDFVNLMTYDMGRPPRHHSALYKSDKTSLSVDQSVALHRAAGVPDEKIVVGAPFYGKTPSGMDGDGTYYCKMSSLFVKYTEKWDDTAKVPYLVDSDGAMVFAYDNPRSIGLKADYVIAKGLRGMMFWNWEGDNPTTWEMTHAISDKLL